MIRNFKNKNLSKLFSTGDGAKINPEHLKRIKQIIFILNTAEDINKINAPGFNLHPLKGDFKDNWAVSVSGNYRIIFKFDHLKKEVYDVDYIDYH